MKKYQTFSYGKKKDRVVIYLLRKHGKNGVGGLVAGPMFKEYIGLVVDETPNEDRDYRYACLTKFESTGMNAIMMDRSIFCGFKQGDVMSRTTVFHELGHCFFGHIGKNGFDTKEYAERREASVSNQAVAPEELEADAFAAKYLGAEYVSNGLRRITEMELSSGVETNSPTIIELEMRIDRIKLSPSQKNATDRSILHKNETHG